MGTVDKLLGGFAEKIGVGTGKNARYGRFGGGAVLFRLFSRAFQPEEGRPGGFGAFFIVPHLFAYRGFISHYVEYIIGYLKRNAQFTAVTARRGALFFSGVRKNRAAFAGIE